jgi:hypothetical protein
VVEEYDSFKHLGLTVHRLIPSHRYPEVIPKKCGSVRVGDYPPGTRR